MATVNMWIVRSSPGDTGTQHVRDLAQSDFNCISMKQQIRVLGTGMCCQELSNYAAILGKCKKYFCKIIINQTVSK